jgi:hypothetical protein
MDAQPTHSNTALYGLWSGLGLNFIISCAWSLFLYLYLIEYTAGILVCHFHQELGRCSFLGALSLEGKIRGWPERRVSQVARTDITMLHSFLALDLHTAH